jgi:hypothetical protein
MSTVALVSLYDVENNAVRQLAAGLRQRGFEVAEVYFKDWRNNAIEWPTPLELDRLVRVLQRRGPALVGISLRASAYEQVCARVCAHLRRHLEAPLVLGGWHATVRPERCLELVDIICVGEADHSFPLFVERYLAGGLERAAATPGFHLRRADGSVVRNAPLPLVTDLDALPWRDYASPHKWSIQRGELRQGDPMARDPLCQVMCSIGCVQRCSFCHNSFDSGAQGPKLRMRSVDSVLGEIKARIAANPAIRRVRFDDEIFGQRIPWLQEFARRYPREVGLPFDFLTEPSVVSDAYARLLAQAGAAVAHLGVQSSSHVNNDRLDRRSSPEQTQAAVRRLNSHGLRLRYLVMIDIPGTTDTDREDLYRFLATAPRPYDLYLFSLTWFPGSKMVEEALADGSLDPVEVEGLAQKTFDQYRVDLGWPRPAEDTWWLALMVLVASQTVPPRLLEPIVRGRIAREDPTPIVKAARVATYAKTGRTALGMIRSGELTPSLVRRWWNPQRMITM